MSKKSSFLVFNFGLLRVLQVKKNFACDGSRFCSYFHIVLYLKNPAPPDLNPVSAPGRGAEE